MPERIAKTDAVPADHRRRPAPARSSWSRSEWVPGNKVVYVKNTDYVPRKERAELGRRRQGRQGRPRRVALHPGRGHRRRGAQQPARSTGGEQVPPDLIPVLAQQQGRHGREHRSARLDRRAALQPPAAAVQQREDAPGRAGPGRPEGLRDRRSPAIRRTGKPARRSSPAARRWRAKPAPSALKGKRDIEKAKQLVKESGYKGEKVVILMSATDQPIVHCAGAGHAETS